MSHGSKNEMRYPLEKPCRTLFVRNVNYGATEDEIRDTFEKYGRVKEIFSRISTRGMVFVTFSDLRDAEQAMKNLQRTNIKGRPIDIHFSLPREDDDKFAESANKYLNDSLFITLLDTENEFTSEDARKLFAPFGDIKDVREWSKKDQKIVEFFDTDDCAKAKDDMEGKEFKGGKLTIKYALAPKNTNSRNNHRGPQRRPRGDRNYDAPYSRPPPRNDRGSHMDYRPAHSGVNPMIKDLASALQQQAQRYAGGYPGPQNEYSSQYPPGDYLPPMGHDYPPHYPPYYPGPYGNSPPAPYGWNPGAPGDYGSLPPDPRRTYGSSPPYGGARGDSHSHDGNGEAGPPPRYPPQSYYDLPPSGYPSYSHPEDTPYDRYGGLPPMGPGADPGPPGGNRYGDYAPPPSRGPPSGREESPR